MFVKIGRKMSAFVAVTLLVSIAAAVIRTFLLVTVVDTKTGLYEVDAGLAGCFEVTVLVFIVAVIATGVLLFKKTGNLAEPDSSSTFTVFGSGLCAFMYLSFFVYGIYGMMKGSSSNSIFVTLQTFLCVPCAINHLYICAKEKREKSTPQALLAMSVPVFFALRLIEVFMNIETQINASQRSLELLMLCAIMMFCLYESEFTVQKKESGKELFAKYYVSALAAIALVIVAVIPYLLVSVFWVFESSSVIIDVLECCIMIYAAARIFTAKTK